MIERAVRALACVLVLAAIASARGAAAATPPGLAAEPAVRVVEVAPDGTGSSTIVLRNDGTTSVVAGSITAAAGCSAAVVASPLTGFTLVPGATRTLTVSCSPSAPSMQRCGYQVRAPDRSVLLELEAVCAYGSTASLVPSDTALDLGAVPVGGAASRRISLHNTAARALDQLFVEITDLAGNFAAAAPCNPDARACDAAIAPVGPDGTTSLVVTCTPRSAGPQSAELHVTTSAGTRLPAPIALRCTGIAATAPVLAVSPSAIDVGAVEQLDAQATATVHLANTGAAPLTLLDIQIVDGGAGAAVDWSYAAGAPCDAAIPSVCSLAPGQATDLTLVFDPSAIARRDATLLVNYHDTADRSASVPLRGVGHGATLELVGGTSKLDFGVLPVGATATLTLQVRNRGTRTLTAASATVMPDAPAFTVAPTFEVPPAATTTITVTCTPASAGTFTSRLLLASPEVQTSAIEVALQCTADPAMVLTATPPALLLGEVRAATPVSRRIAIASVGGPVSLTSAALELGLPGLGVTGAPATTPASLELAGVPAGAGPLADRLLVQPSIGPTLAVPISGTAVTASYEVPTAVSLGTFCVDQPTTPRILALGSTGTATITLPAPSLQSASSPFDLALVAPLAYPAALAPLGRALVAVTPRRQASAGITSGDLIWRTDVASATVSATRLTASFVDNGPAIAPPALGFGRTPIHLDTRNAQQVTLQNCSASLLQLDAPQVPPPFSIDSPGVPTALQPGETARFSVGFHPTKLGPVTKTLILTSPQLPGIELTVALTGEGVTGQDGIGGDSPIPDVDRTSFYACGGCASNEATNGATNNATGALALGIAALAVLRPRRSRRPTT